MANYTEAHADVTAVREAYERELLAAGSGRADPRSRVRRDGDGCDSEGVPAGEWLLLGWREESHAVKAAQDTDQGRGGPLCRRRRR